MKITAINYEQWVKIFKAAGYVGLSALLSYLTSALAADPNLFGVLTPVFNIVLATLKQLFTPTK